MSYAMKFSDEDIKSLYQLREKYGRGSIISQCRRAIHDYLIEQEKLLGPITLAEDEENN